MRTLLLILAFLVCVSASADELIIVTRNTCPPCQRLKRDILRRPDMTKGHSIVLLEGKRDMDRYGVTSVPTVIRVRDGKEIDRQTGYGGPDSLKEWLRK